MNNFKKACLAATVSVMFAPAAFAGVYQDVVSDERSNIVMNTFNNCVLTKWDSNSNQCGMSADLRRIDKEMRTVYFDFNRSTLNRKEKAKLDELAAIVRGAKDVESVDIVGFADEIGDAGYNKTLSKRRARTVKSYLSAKGLRTRNVSLKGMGEDGSVTNCDQTDRAAKIACLAEDRRVEIEFNFVR
ncbi:MAG: OmpA family protein [Rickettsiales bacterium]